MRQRDLESIGGGKTIQPGVRPIAWRGRGGTLARKGNSLDSGGAVPITLFIYKEDYFLQLMMTGSIG